MPAQNIHVIKEDFKNLQEASEAFAVLQKQFRYMQEHIDVENIIAKSLTAAVIKAGTLTADEIAANTITADKMDVDELSAITANMGKLTSGEIYGAYIATAEGAFPRAEMSSVGDFFRALASASIYTEITPSFGGAPAIHSTDGVTTGLIQTFSVLGSTFAIMSTTDIDIRPGSVNKINLPGWSQLYSGAETQTLADALNNLAAAITGKAISGVSTGSSGGHNHGLSSGRYIMTYDSAGNELGLQMYSSAPSHTHAQV